MAVSSVGTLGEGSTQGRSVVVPVHVARPALHGHHLELGADPLVEVERQLGDGHPVPHRHAELADEDSRSPARASAPRPAPADGIGPVGDDDRLAGPCHRPQAVGHRVDEGVDAGADVLQVDDQHVDEAQHLGGRLARLTVEREDRDVAPRVLVVRRLDHVVLQVRPIPVLRPEDGRERVVGRDAQPLGDMAEVVVDRGRIGDDADAEPVQARRGEECFGAELHGPLLSPPPPRCASKKGLPRQALYSSR